MNICLLTSTYLPLIGGLEIVVHNLAIALTDLGHQVYVVTPRPPNLKVTDDYAYKVIRFGFKGHGRLNLTSVLAVTTLAWVVKRYQIDVIHVHNVFKPGSWSYYFSRFFKHTPIIGTPHGDDIQVAPEINWGKRLDPACDTIVRRNVTSFTLVTAISKQIFAALQDIRIDKANIHLVPNGIWAHRFQSGSDKASARQRLGIPEQSFTLLSIGRNHPVKGYKCALEAIQELRNRGVSVTYIIIGRNMDPLVEKARELGISACLITPGQLPSEQFSDYLMAADSYLLPSIMESFGVTTLEAMSAGLPAVVTRSAGISGWVSREVCLVVEAGNSRALVDAIGCLIDNPDKVRQMGLKAKVESGRFDWTVVAREYESVYKKAIELNR